MASNVEAVSKVAASPDRASPISAGSRIDSLDVLRGFAVLMIFVVNVKMMANGFNHYRHRSLWEGEIAQWIAFFHGEFVHGKFVTIFTALFGAGLALLLARENPVPMPVVLRRLFWLAVFGGLHLIFLREGDILIWYALVGFLAIPFARLRATTVLIVGLALQIAAYAYSATFPLSDEGVPLLWSPAFDAHHGVAEIMLGTLGDQISARIDAAPYYMIDLFIIGGVWIGTFSLMLIGMGLLKTGFLTGQLPLKSYMLWGALGVAVGAAEHVLRAIFDDGSAWESLVIGVASHCHYLGGTLAWSALVIGAVSAGWRASAFGAVGRTAFTVYILQSVIGLALFSSLGLGLFGQLSLASLMLITLGVWAFFLIGAPLWLARYRFGPLEWVWRSLTYGTMQPLRRVGAG